MGTTAEVPSARGCEDPVKSHEDGGRVGTQRRAFSCPRPVSAGYPLRESSPSPQQGCFSGWVQGSLPLCWWNTHSPSSPVSVSQTVPAPRQSYSHRENPGQPLRWDPRAPLHALARPGGRVAAARDLPSLLSHPYKAGLAAAELELFSHTVSLPREEKLPEGPWRERVSPPLAPSPPQGPARPTRPTHISTSSDFLNQGRLGFLRKSHFHFCRVGSAQGEQACGGEPVPAGGRPGNRRDGHTAPF